ncbi:hypothetical protein [Streptomyces roseoverticillatus]|uniref:hypothetical protein n=1 Tax=Streptomyces roseoverticillatus TaxID=66429 RepID=UPI0004BF0B44|nr:hypothetical protein [Streptomyces roseoverticillatus]
MDTLEWGLGAFAYISAGLAFCAVTKTTPSACLAEQASEPDPLSPAAVRTICVIVVALWPIALVHDADWALWAHRIARHPRWNCLDENDMYDHDDHPACRRTRWTWLLGR